MYIHVQSLQMKYKVWPKILTMMITTRSNKKEIASILHNKGPREGTREPSHTDLPGTTCSKLRLIKFIWKDEAQLNEFWMQSHFMKLKFISLWQKTHCVNIIHCVMKPSGRWFYLCLHMLQRWHQEFIKVYTVNSPYMRPCIHLGANVYVISWRTKQ